MSSNSTSEIQKLYEDLCYLKRENLDDSSKYRQIYSQLQNLILEISPYADLPPRQTALGDAERPLLSAEQVAQLKNQIVAYQNVLNARALPKSTITGLSLLTQDQWTNELHGQMKKATTIALSKKEQIKTFAESQVAKSMATESAYLDKNIEKAMGRVEGYSESFVRIRNFELDLFKKSGLMSEDSLRKIELEQKFLEVLPVYQSLRCSIFGDFFKLMQQKARPDSEKTYYDRNFYRRSRPKRSAVKAADNFELQIKKEQSYRRKEKHLKFMEQLFSYNENYQSHFKTRKNNLKKSIQNVKQRHEWIRRKNFKESAEQNRTKNLEKGDITGYIEQIKLAKDERINDIFEILRETDNYLREISKKIISLKKVDNVMAPELEEQNSAWLKNVDDIKDFDIQKSTLDTDNYNKFYYSLTHSTSEEIKEQPSMLEGGTLKNYQLTGLQWLVSLYNNKLNGILADEMGLGKTIQTISLFCYLMEYKQNYGPFLIVVPLTTLQNWIMEFDKWAPTVKKVIYNGNQAQRKIVASYMKTAKWNLCLTTYDFILRDKSELTKYHWKYIVIDEGHKMKNPKSKFAQTLGHIYDSQNRILLTGTPLQNNLPELWSLLNFLLPQVFSSCDDFERWFKLPISNFGNERDMELSEEENLLIIRRFHQVLRPFLLRRIKKEVESELPNKVKYILMVELSAWQKIVYDRISKKQSMSIGPSSHGSRSQRTLQNIMMQKRKICNHPYLFMDGDFPIDEMLIRCSGKFEVLDRIVPKLISCGHRLLLFTQMAKLIDILEYFMALRNIKFLRLDGQTKPEDRNIRMAMFNKPNSQFPVFILSTRAGGLGLNLQAADTVILVDSDWNPALDAQAIDRAHRIGQTKEVRVFRLVTNTEIERDILKKASEKQYLDEMVVQTGLFNQRSTEKERRSKIEELIKTNTGDYEYMNEEETPSDHEINKMISRSDEEFALFTKVDKERYERDKKIYPNFSPDMNYRLLTDSEVPEWVKYVEVKKEKEIGLRKRRKNYNLNAYAAYDENLDKILQNENSYSRRRNRNNAASKLANNGRGATTTQVAKPEEEEEEIYEVSEPEESAEQLVVVPPPSPPSQQPNHASLLLKRQKYLLSKNKQFKNELIRE